MSENHSRESVLLGLALKQPPEKRAAFLDAVCEGDADLRARLDGLLGASERPDGVPPNSEDEDSHTVPMDSPDVQDEAVGKVIDCYKIRERIGEGGCGAVYAADQTEPVRRRVALKIVKLGMDTKQVVARFEAERQALAMMDHPNIAKVLDAGATESGRPYFVMELVRGIPITAYCDQNKLSTKQRIDLFIQVCQAIQHAHQKGIIHRDIKPNNILVTLHDGVPVPKVIDFGIAKATEGRLTDVTVYTQLYQFIGTPTYMSPEQAEMSGLDIDTRSDIYSLGVLLYELLTGRTPFDGHALMSLSVDDIRKTIREREPPRPSTRLSTLQGEESTRTARTRGVELPRLVHQIRGDLDWIVMKCLEKDRTRRYETANGLAMDLKRHLTNEPVVARPPSTFYKVQKAWRRNKVVYTSGIAVTLALVTGLATSMRLLRETQLAKDDTQTALDEKTRAEADAKNALAKSTALTVKLQTKEANLKGQLYYTDMNLAGHAVNEPSGLYLLDKLTRKWIPGPSATDDPRGWEWFLLRSLLHHDLRTFTFEQFGEMWVLWGQNGCYLFSDHPDDTLSVTQVATSPPAEDIPVATLPLDTDEFARPVWMPSPDGRWLALSDPAGGIEIRDSRTGLLRRTLRPDVANKRFFAAPNWIFWSQNGDQLAAFGLDGNLQFWSVTNSQASASVPVGRQVVAVDWEPGGDRVAITTQDANFDFALLMWDPRERELRPLPVPDRYGVWTARWSPAGDRIAVSHKEGFKVGIYDAQTWQLLQSLSGSRGPALSFAWSPDGRYLAAGGSDWLVRVWDVESGQATPTHEFAGHLGPVVDVRWNPAGTHLVSMEIETGFSFKVWRLSDGRISDLPQGARLLDESVGRLFLGWSPDGERYATTDGNQILVWDAHERQPLTRFGELNELAADPSQELTSVDLESRLRAAWGPDGKRLAVGLADRGREIFVFDTTSGDLLQTFAGGTLSGDSLQWSPDGRMLAAAHGIKVVLWNPRTGQPVRSWVDQDQIVTSLAWNPDGVRLAFATSAQGPPWDNRIRVWNTRTNEQLLEIPTQENVNLQLNWDPQETRLIACQMTPDFRMWNGETGERLQVFSGHFASVDSLSWSPDGSRIASGGKDAALRLWDPDTGQETLALTDFPALPYLFWRPSDGRVIATQMTFTGLRVLILDASTGYEEEARRRQDVAISD